MKSYFKNRQALYTEPAGLLSVTKKTDVKHAGLFVWFNVNFALN